MPGELLVQLGNLNLLAVCRSGLAVIGCILENSLPLYLASFAWDGVGQNGSRDVLLLKITDHGITDHGSADTRRTKRPCG